MGYQRIAVRRLAGGCGAEIEALICASRSTSRP